MQFSAFGREIHYETTTTWKVTVKPLKYIPLQEQFDNFSLNDIFASDTSEFETAWKRYPASQTDTHYRLSY